MCMACYTPCDAREPVDLRVVWCEPRRTENNWRRRRKFLKNGFVLCDCQKLEGWLRRCGALSEWWKSHPCLNPLIREPKGRTLLRGVTCRIRRDDGLTGLLAGRRRCRERQAPRARRRSSCPLGRGVLPPCLGSLITGVAVTGGDGCSQEGVEQSLSLPILALSVCCCNSLKKTLLCLFFHLSGNLTSKNLMSHISSYFHERVTK